MHKRFPFVDNLWMYKTKVMNSSQTLQLQLEEAIQMLRLVAAGKRTCLEVEEWLNVNYSQNFNENDILTSLFSNTEKDKND